MAAQIRFAQPLDAAGILAIYAPYCESTTVSFEVVAPSLDEMQQRITRISPNYPWLVAEVDGQIAGYVYASRHRERAAYRWAVDVAVYIAPQYQRCGVGRALYRTLFELLREQGYFKAFAGVTLPNAGSVGLHESLGFVPAATFRGVGYKNGRWLDVGWWQLELRPEQQDPTDPRPFDSIRGSNSVVKIMAEAQARLGDAIRRSSSIKPDTRRTKKL
jgi:phosphinothricin acetyltransferase